MFSPKIGASLQKKPADMNRIISYMIYNLCGSEKVHWIWKFIRITLIHVFLRVILFLDPAIFHVAEEGGFWITFPDLPEWLNEAATAAGVNFSQVLQEALMQKINL